MRQILRHDFLQPKLSHLVTSSPGLQVPTRVEMGQAPKLSGGQYWYTLEFTGAYASLSGHQAKPLELKYSYRGKTIDTVQKSNISQSGQKLNKGYNNEEVVQYLFNLDFSDVKPRIVSRSPSPPEFVHVTIHLPETGEVLEFAITPPSEEAP